MEGAEPASDAELVRRYAQIWLSQIGMNVSLVEWTGSSALSLSIAKILHCKKGQHHLSRQEDSDNI